MIIEWTSTSVGNLIALAATLMVSASPNYFSSLNSYSLCFRRWKRHLNLCSSVLHAFAQMRTWLSRCDIFLRKFCGGLEFHKCA